MGKPISKIVETLVLQHQPVRYVVTNTDKIVLVTHDYKYAQKIAGILSQLDDTKKYFIKIK